MNAPLGVVREDTRLELVLNRPERRNALSRELVGALVEALRAAGRDARVRVMLLRGEGPAFCAGLDLDELEATAGTREVSGASSGDDLSHLLDLFDALEGLPQPTIAVVQGPAVAGGATLAGLCDFVLCGREARFGYPGIRRGLVAPVVMPYLVRQVGLRRARQLLLTGELLGAEEAVAWGLANEVVLDGDPLEVAREKCECLTRLSAGALARTKEFLRRLAGEQDCTGGALRAEFRRLFGFRPAD